MAIIRNRYNSFLWLGLITILVVVISILHYSTPTEKWQNHLIYMQSYFIPILIAAFQFGVRGGLGTAVAVSIIYFPHIMLQWGGFSEENLMRFMQIVLFNIIGYLTGLKAQAEDREKIRYQRTAEELRLSLEKTQQQAEQLSELESQLRLADRLAVVGELSASLAHEVRNPLGSIRGTAEILKEELPQKYRRSEFFQILLQETNRLNEVLENYLNFARKQKQTDTQFGLNDVVKSVTQLLDTSARKSEVDFDVQLPESHIELYGNPNDLRQVLMNLLLNALQAMPDGGKIFISGEVLDDKTTEQEDSGMGTIQLKIMDQGMGINPENFEKVFHPFYSTKEDGTGLGLAIVKRLTDENHWQLEMESHPEQGTEFRLKIPFNPNQGFTQNNV